MRKIILTVFAVFILFILGCTTGNVANSSGFEASGTLNGDIRVINVRAFRFDFDPNPIIVNQGEKVKLIVTSTDTTHGIVIPEYGINVPAPVGRPTVVDFVADKAGTFSFFCNVYCGSGHSAMRGSLVVKENQ